MTPEEILLEVQKISRMAMDSDKDRELEYRLPFSSDKRKDYRYPDYYPGYREAAENYDAIMVHADKSVFPATLFTKRAPAQSDKAFEWIRNNYKNVTQPVYMDFTNTVSRGTNDDNWQIIYRQDSEAITTAGLTFQEYVEKGIRDYGSLQSFFKNILIDVKLKDAMGVIAVKPHHIPTVEIDGERVISSTELIEPHPYYYTTKQVVKFKTGEFAFIELYEKSMVDYGNAKKRIGRIYEVYDKDFIYHVTQIGKYIDNQFEIVVYYQHDWKRLPAERLKGIAQIVRGELFFQSPFLFSVDLLDLVAQNAAYLQASIAKCVFPATVMLGDICEFEDSDTKAKCNDGVLGWYDDGGAYHERSCPKCFGIGLVSRLGPLDTLLLNPASRVDGDGDSAVKHKPLEYISPEVHTLEFIEKHNEITEEKARRILHLHTSNSNVKGSEDKTATGMAIDQKGTFAFVMPIIYQAFELFEFMHAASGWMRYRENFKEPTIIYPQSIEIGTAQDILELIAYMKDNGMPSVVIQGEITRYIQSTYYTDKKTTDNYKLILQADRLMALDTTDIVLGVKNNTIKAWEWILHDSVQFFINDLLREKENFFEQDITEQIKAVQDKAKEMAASIKPDDVKGEDILIRENV